MAIEGTFPAPGVSRGTVTNQRLGVDYTSQVWGRVIPISTGRRALTGVPIWAAPAKYNVPFAIPALSSGSGTPNFNYNYYIERTFAIAFGYNLAPDNEHGATGVARIWVDGVLLYDASLPQVERYLPLTLPPGSVVGTPIALGPININIDFTFHPGTESQYLDSDILASQGNLTCAFRGMTYMIVHNFPTGRVNPGAPFEIPTVRVELLDGLHYESSFADFQTLGGPPIDDNPITPDWGQGFLYAFSGFSGSAAMLHKYSIDGMAEVEQHAISGSIRDASTGQSLPYSNIEGALGPVLLDSSVKQANAAPLIITWGNGTFNSSPVISIDATTGDIVDSFGGSQTNFAVSNATAPCDKFGNTEAGGPPPTLADPHNPWTSTAGLGLASVPVPMDACLIKGVEGTITRRAVVVAGHFDDVTPIAYDATGVFDKTVSYSENFNNNIQISPFFHPVEGSPVVSVIGLPLFEIATANGSQPSFQDSAYLVVTKFAVYIVYMGWRNGHLKFIAHEGVWSFGSGLGAGGGVIPTPGSFMTFAINQAQLDSGNNLIIYVRGSDGKAYIGHIAMSYSGGGGETPLGNDVFKGIMPTPGSNTGATFVSIDSINTGTQWAQAFRDSNISFGTMAWQDGTNIEVLLLSDAAQNISNNLTGDSINSWVWDSSASTIYYVHGGTIRQQALNKLSGTEPTIGQICRWIALRYGFADSKITVDANMTDPVLGFYIEKAWDVPQLLQNLGAVYDFSFFESEGQIKFVKSQHGVGAPSPVYALGLDDLALVSEGAITKHDGLITMIDAPDVSPSSTSLQYFDFDNNYNIDTAFYYQPNLIAGQAASGVNNIALPVVMHQAEAYRRATQITVRQLGETVNLQFRLPQKYSAIEPADVLSITKPPFLYLVQIDEVTFNTDHSLSLLGLNFSFDNSIPVKDINPHDPSSPSTAGQNNACTPLALDMPLINIGDDPGHDAVILYIGAVTLGQPNWNNAYLLEGPSEGALVSLGNVTKDVPQGTTPDQLPDTATPFQTDNTFAMTVVLGSAVASEFAGTNDAGLLAGVNAIVVGAPGRWELIYFRDVTVRTNKVVILQGLLRGRRGTELHTGDHLHGDNVYLVASASSTFKAGQINGVALVGAVGADFFVESTGSPTIGQTTVLTKLSPLAGLSQYPWAPTAYAASLGSTAQGSGSPAYTNPGGQGDRRNQIAVTAASPTAQAYALDGSSGLPPFLVDGGTSAAATDAIKFANGMTDLTITFDFTSYGFLQRITEYTWTQSTNDAMGTFAFEGTVDGVTWTTINTSTIGGSTSTVNTFTNANGYRLYRLRQTAGTVSSTPWVEEVTFKIVASVANANDIALTWTRRDRLGASFVTTPQPMSEVTEEYDLEILNGSGTVLRTVHGLTYPAYVYTNANQGTDGYSPPLASLQFRTYQLSGSTILNGNTGRGFTTTQTVPVT